MLAITCGCNQITFDGTRSVAHSWRQPIKSFGGATEQVGDLRLTCPTREPFACVPKARIAIGTFVDRKVAFKHTAFGAERLNGGFNIRAPCLRQCFGRWWICFLMKIETSDAHRHATDLDGNIGTL